MLVAAGFAGGAMNALAGGGTFATLPALVAAGVPSNLANSSSTVALFPGGLASAWTYRDRIGPVGGIGVRPLLAATLVGGLLGSLLLLLTSTRAFDAIVPWLLLIATLALAFARPAGEALRRRVTLGRAPVLAIQFVLGLYGGYFGGGVGLMMLAAWGLLGGTELSALQGPRTLMVSAANSTAVVVFVLAGAVAWSAALAVLGGAILGGWGGARLGRRLPSQVVRAGTLAVTAMMTIVFFVRAYT